jgi:hypothetical protein
VKTIKHSLKSVLIIILLILILGTGLGSPAEGLYAAILLIIPLTLVSIISSFLLNSIFDKLKVVKKFDRFFLGISLPILGSLVYLAGYTLMFGDLIAALKDTWFIMVTIIVMIAINVVISTEKIDKSDD